MPTAAFTTLGCKVNQYETQRILESFENAGFGIVAFDQPADVYVLNTCSVTSVAESKSRYAIRKAARTNPEAKIVVTGCAAQMAINRSEPLADAHVVVPNPAKLDTLRHFLAAFPGHAPSSREPCAAPRPAAGKTRANLKIQDGCSVLCSYCSIPYTRPGMTSRPVGEVLEEAEKMVSLGYKEIVLTGVLIGSYGPDTGSEGPDFESLIERLANIAGMGRIRISSIEMRQVTARLIELLQAGLAAPHLHIPLQSGDSQVLRDMNRPYSQDDYLELCRRLYRDVQGISLTADVMVGFPTETADRFESTAYVCREAGYLKSHVFRFSPRFGTPADAWGDPVAPEEKARRSLVLAEIARTTSEAHCRRFLGTTARVLVEGKETKQGLLTGLADNYLEVAFAGPQSLKRQFATVRLEEFRDGVVYGELASAQSSGLAVLPTLAG